MRKEGPQRVHTALDALMRSGQLQQCKVVCGHACDDVLLASREDLLRVHVPDLVDALIDAGSPDAAIASAAQDGLRAKGETALSADGQARSTGYVTAHTSVAVRATAGLAARLAERVLRGEAAAAMMVTRPAGHHVTRDTIGGGGIVNNVAVAAAAAVAAGAERVLIVDFDVHHGNGTQAIFYSDPNVLTISIHTFVQKMTAEADERVFYPSAGLPSHVGSGAGAGRNVNLACTCEVSGGLGGEGGEVPSGGFGDADYAAIFSHLVMPIARSFDPSLVVVAAGFDSARGDPLGGFDLTAQGYGFLMRQLLQLAHGKVLVIPEGGYNARALAAGMDACLRELLVRTRAVGDEHGDGRQVASCAAEAAAFGEPTQEVAATLAASFRCIAPYWPVLAGWDDLRVAGQRLGDVAFPTCLECATHAPCWCGAGRGRGPLPS